MKRKRRKFSAEFKARVALEAIKSQKTINQIAQAEGVLPVQVSAWKKELQERMPELFQSGAKELFPVSRIVFDGFHLMQMAGQALDEVRKSLRRLGKARRVL